MRRAENALEFLDRAIAGADLTASLADIDRLNAWFGGYALSLREVRRLAARAARPLVVLDVGGGHGTFAARVVRWARRERCAVHVLVLDRDAAPLGLAGPLRAAYPEIHLVRADAAALPFCAEAVDMATASLTLHHLEPEAAVAGLREMARVARLGVVVNDLRRTRAALALVWIATRLVARHPFSRHDGPLSVRRAYSVDELQTLAARAGLARLRVREYPLLGRLVATTA